MIHGIISDASFFHDIADILKQKFTVITYDRRGYGAAADPDREISDYSLDAQAEDAAEVLRAHTEEPAWVFGNSAGGLVAVKLALRHPELVRGLILLEPSLIFDADSEKLIMDWNRELHGYIEAKKSKKALPAFVREIGKNGSNGKLSLEKMGLVYKNLRNFLGGELDEIHYYRPDLQELQALPMPKEIYITEQGKDMLFGKTSRAGASALGWKTKTVCGYHNTVEENPEEMSACILNTIELFGR